MSDAGGGASAALPVGLPSSFTAKHTAGGQEGGSRKRRRRSAAGPQPVGSSLSAAAPPAAAAGCTWRVGDAVEVLWRGKPYDGVVRALEDSAGRALVAYDPPFDRYPPEWRCAPVCSVQSGHSSPCLPWGQEVGGALPCKADAGGLPRAGDPAHGAAWGGCRAHLPLGGQAQLGNPVRRFHSPL